MANEIKITEMKVKMWRGDVQLYSHQFVVGQQVDSSATQDNSAAFNDETQMITVYNTGTACNFLIDDVSDTTVTATNSDFIASGERRDILVRPGQYFHAKQV